MRLRNFEFGFPLPNLELLIDARLRGARAEFVQMLPPPGRDEDPADIFVDLAESDTAWREGLRAASTQLLLRWVGEFQPADANRVQALGELCYLAARIGNTAALPHLRTLVGRKDATGLLHPGEDLRLRALRALVGLLGAAENVQVIDYRPVLTEALAEPRLALTALVGLIGLWPAETETFLQSLPTNYEHGELLEIGLDLVFPSKNPLR
jgi:hypothetical protein